MVPDELVTKEEDLDATREISSIINTLISAVESSESLGKALPYESMPDLEQSTELARLDDRREMARRLPWALYKARVLSKEAMSTCIDEGT